jgi:zinc protease
MRALRLFVFVLVVSALAVGQQAAAPSNVVVLPSPSPLYEVQLMVRAGSADDPAGKEGTAALVGQMLIEGGFGDPKNPVTKERLAEITRPWGSGATPGVLVEKQATTITMRVPRDAFPQFVREVLSPMMKSPLWLTNELDRIRRESLAQIRSNLRFEQQELLGLLVLDNYVLEGTPLQELQGGTVKGIESITRDDLQAFFQKHYHRGNMFIAVSFTDKAAMDQLMNALPAGASSSRASQPRAMQPAAVNGRHVLIVTQPNAIATGLHVGFPYAVTRSHPDYWPLFVGNVFFGVHRDSFGRLYNLIREERGYNYGDYSYVEYLPARPFSLFPRPNTPRDAQYYSIWIRPVGHQYTHFIMKAMTAELDRFVKEGLTPEQVAEAKIKARTLYLNYAESASRQLGYRLDDLFYGMRDNGYLVEMLRRIDAVTPEQVNAAIKKHLQSANLKYVIVTNESVASKLADDIANNANVQGKTLAEYHIAEPVPPEKKEMLARDEQWKAYPLNIKRENIRIVKTEELFETSARAAQAAKPGGTD